MTFSESIEAKLAIAAVSATLGAMLGFLSTSAVQIFERRRKEAAAGVYAMFVLSQQWNVLRLYRRGLRERLDFSARANSRMPVWAHAFPISTHFPENLKHDYQSMSFLIRAGRPNVLSQMAHCEQLYFDLKSTVERLCACCVELQEATAKAGIPRSGQTPKETVEAAIGPAILSRTEDLLMAVLNHTEHDDPIFTAAANSLSRYLATAFSMPLSVRHDADMSAIDSLQMAAAVPQRLASERFSHPPGAAGSAK